MRIYSIFLYLDAAGISIFSVRKQGVFWPDRNFYYYNSPNTRLRIHFDGTIHLCNKIVTYKKTESRALANFLGRKKRIKGTFANIGAHTDSGISNTNFNYAVIIRSGYFKNTLMLLALSFHRIHCVNDQI